jgi:hypothetical protein
MFKEAIQVFKADLIQNIGWHKWIVIYQRIGLLA